MKPFYITTPIYYVNDKPHIGHAYTTIAADVIARYQKLRGRPTRFLTGLDEHGLKIERRAKELGIAPQALGDQMAPPFKRAWEVLNCAYDDFIRTTEPRHKERVQDLWKRLERAGDIYLGQYEGWYCVGCESYYTEKELVEGNVCPVHKKPIERVEEKSYFFRLSKYAEKLLALYETKPPFVRPESRLNEVTSFVRGGLHDLSISRTTFHWGVPVPGNAEHVMYVWLDALANYITALGGPAKCGEAPLFDRFWTPTADVVQLVGKDILRFHAVYWPAFLMSAGVAPPTQVWAHGWLTVNGEKMSKSLGNFLPPEPLCTEFGADALRYYLMRDVSFGLDGDFSHANLLSRYHGDLGNGLGNLLNRIVASIVKKSFGGKVPEVDWGALALEDLALADEAKRSAEETAHHLNAVEPQRALEAAWKLVAAANKYVDQSAPWALAKEQKLDRLAQVTCTVLESLRWLSIMLWPVMPRKCDALRHQLGLAPVQPAVDNDQWPSAWGELKAGTATREGKPLFPRFDKDQEKAILERLGVAIPAPPSTEKKSSEKSHAPDHGEGISIDDFAKVQLRVGLVLSAEAVPKSDRLLCLRVDLSEAEPRQILAGLHEHYAPEELVGRRVVVVANLRPRKMMGLESHGMVLAASQGKIVRVLSADAALLPGSEVR